MTYSVTGIPASVTRVHVGTSGWGYGSWRPGFYPAGLEPEAFLGHYAQLLHAVELNSTKYRLPSEDQFARWAGQVPDGFLFAVKAPPGVMRRIDTFQDRVRVLGDRLGCVRVVVESPRDDGFLELLLGSVDPSLRWVLDLRHPSWNGVEARLAEVGAVRVGDTEGAAGWCYLRFRDPPYDDGTLTTIAASVAGLLDRGLDVFAFFRHEEAPTAPEYAARVLRLLAGGAS